MEVEILGLCFPVLLVLLLYEMLHCRVRLLLVHQAFVEKTGLEKFGKFVRYNGAILKENGRP